MKVFYQQARLELFTDKLYECGFKYMGHGMYRKAYCRGKVVVKVPKGHCGLVDNALEVHNWRLFRNKPNEHGIVFAPCRLIDNGCLMMVKVHEDRIDRIDLPDWANDIDGKQVGFYRGRLVAYDSACDVFNTDEATNKYLL